MPPAPSHPAAGSPLRRPRPSLASQTSALNANSATSTQPPASYHQRLLSLRDRIPLFFAGNAASANRTHDRAGSPDLEEGDRLLFSHEDDEEERPSPNAATRPQGSYPPIPSHVPLPARPPQFGAPSSPAPGNARIVGGGQGNDGVFANLSAKPDGQNGRGGDFVGGDDDFVGGDKDEVLPAYEVAAMDTTPPYWETTVITPQGFLGPDDICVDGLPVGNVFSFAWNLLVSMSFQFVGFLLTYLLHTTHAAKNGSRAGLGITLIQLGFYLKQRVDHPELFLNEIGGPGDETGLGGAAGPNDDMRGWTWWGGVIEDESNNGLITNANGELETASATLSGAAALAATATLSAIGSLPTQVGSALAGVLDASDPDAVASQFPTLTGNTSQMLTNEEMMRMSSTANEWVAFFLVTVGTFLLLGGCLSYWRAVRFARAVRAGMDQAQATQAAD